MENKLKTVDAETLLSTPMSKTMFIVDNLIPQGVNVISGASKIGKSWLMLWLGYTGTPKSRKTFWGEGRAAALDYLRKENCCCRHIVFNQSAFTHTVFGYSIIYYSSRFSITS